MQNFKVALVHDPGPSMSDTGPLKFHFPIFWIYHVVQLLLLTEDFHFLFVDLSFGMQKRPEILTLKDKFELLQY